MNNSCNVLIYGGGAVGSVFGWRLAQQSHNQVSVVCRSNYERVKQAGFSMRTTVWGDGHFRPSTVYQANHLWKTAPHQKFDYVVCANKITDDGHPSILHDLRSCVGPETTLVSVQNGMDVELPLRRAFPRNTILSAICNIGCTQTTPGHVQQNTGLSPSAFLIGTFGESVLGRQVDANRRDALIASDVKFSSIDDVRKQRWRKLIFNSVWNSTTALTDMDTHQALQRPDTLGLASRLAHEACQVATKSGVHLEDGYPNLVIDLAGKSKPITPSTLQDVRKRRPLEVCAIWGFLVSQAAACDVSIPYTKMVHDLLRQMSGAFVREQALQSGAQSVSPWSVDRVPDLTMPRSMQNVKPWLNSNVMDSNGVEVMALA